MKNIMQFCVELILKYLRLLVSGLLIGIANIIPGVSGGTMAVVTGVYDRFVDWSVR